MSRPTLSGDSAVDKAREMLAEVYTPEGVEIWLTHRHRLLGGRRAVEVLRDDPEQVFAVIEQLITGAFS